MSCPCISLQSKRQNKREKQNKREEQKRAFSSWDPLALSAFRLRPLDPCDASCPSRLARAVRATAVALHPRCALANLHAHRPNASMRSDPLAAHLSRASSTRLTSKPIAHAAMPSLCNLPLRAGRIKWAAPVALSPSSPKSSAAPPTRPASKTKRRREQAAEALAAEVAAAPSPAPAAPAASRAQQSGAQASRRCRRRHRRWQQQQRRRAAAPPRSRRPPLRRPPHHPRKALSEQA